MQRKSLIAKIHIGKNQLGLDDDTYRGLLSNTCLLYTSDAADE